jgi:transcriptional regulator with XRE-family HTH domain
MLSLAGAPDRRAAPNLDEYAAIRELRKRNWIAAHIRERRYELDLTQQEVAERAETSHSFISKVEGGDHIPTIPVLKRILAVLDEELLIGIERQVPDEEPEREVAPVPELIWTPICQVPNHQGPAEAGPLLGPGGGGLGPSRSASATAL